MLGPVTGELLTEVWSNLCGMVPVLGVRSVGTVVLIWVDSVVVTLSLVKTVESSAGSTVLVTFGKAKRGVRSVRTGDVTVGIIWPAVAPGDTGGTL